MFDNNSEVLDAFQVSVLFISSSRVSVASVSNQGPSLLPSGPIRREQEEARFLSSSCSLWVFSAVDPPVFLYSVFNKHVLKHRCLQLSSFRFLTFFGSTFFSQVCPGTTQLVWRRPNTKKINHFSSLGHPNLWRLYDVTRSF